MPRLASAESRERFANQEVAYLATADADGVPHIVPITFALVGDTLYWAIDHKPKTGRLLKRLANIAVNPKVAVLVDRYDGNWEKLWWARADGAARVVTGEEELGAALRALIARYPQYAANPPEGEVTAVDIAHWSGWAANPTRDAARRAE